MAFDGMPSLDGSQSGESSSARSVRQIPPPAAPTSSVQSCFSQRGEMASDVTRPEFVGFASGIA